MARVLGVSEIGNFKAESRGGGHFLTRKKGDPTPKTSRSHVKNTFFELLKLKSSRPRLLLAYFLVRFQN